jgi:excisionase family DNA binding protein
MHPGQLSYAQMVPKRVSRNLVSHHNGRPSGEPASTASRHGYAHLTQRGFDPIGGRSSKRMQALMVDNDNNKRRRLVEFKDGCRYGKFGKTKAYELIAHERIRAYKMGGKTMIDLDSVDEYHASLPRVETRAS